MPILRYLRSKLSGQNSKKRRRTVHKRNWEKVKAFRTTILERGEAAFQQGVRPGATSIDESYHSYVQSRITYYTTGYYEGKDNKVPLNQVHINAWAAYYMPVPEFEEFFVQTMGIHQSYVQIEAVGARYAAEQIRTFPRLVSMQTALLTRYDICPNETDAERDERLRTVRTDIATKWEADFLKGREELARRGKVENPSDHMNYVQFLEEEEKRLWHDDLTPTPELMHELRIHGWAAHFLAPDPFKVFHARTLIVGDKAAVFAARLALTPKSPRLKHAPFVRILSESATPRTLEVSREDEHKYAWQQSEPLLTYRDTQHEIDAFFAELKADDLHEMAHGEDLSDAPLLLAIARHPLCDWASAFEILHSFSAASYREKLNPDEIAANFDKNEQILFRAFETISGRAHGAGFKTRKFKHNAHWGGPVGRDGSINPYFPVHWQNWPLPEGVLKPTKGKQHKPRISFSGGEIRPTFQEWKKKNNSMP